MTVKIPVTFVIPTRNEERNLRSTVLMIKDWAGQIVVFDSFSDDDTLEIAQEFGLQIAQRKFDNFSDHKNWALDNLPISNQWVFFLDADERISPELRDEIGRVVCKETGKDGYYVARKNFFMGQWVKHAGMYPDWQLRLFRHGKGRYEERIVHEHIVLDGAAGYLTHPLVHNDFKGLERWFERHNRYTSMEAIEVRRVLVGDSFRRIRATLFSRGPERTRIVKEFAYRYLPFRALFVFVWMYFFRGGFLDGRIGFRYCMLKSFVDYQISLKLIELQSVSTDLDQKKVEAAPSQNDSIVSGTRSSQQNNS
jgi:glycosyltransferase involved in cell wall biosynthesis